MPKRSDEAEAFARERIFKVLQGQGRGVIRGLRSLGTRQQLTGAKKKTLVQVCGYLAKNLGACVTTNTWRRVIPSPVE